MIVEIAEKVKKALKLSFKEFITLALLFVILALVVQTNTTVNLQEERWYDATLENGVAVMNTLQSQGFTSANEIASFLAPKPAGRTNLKTAVKNDKIYDCLVDTYGDLAKQAKIAVDF